MKNSKGQFIKGDVPWFKKKGMKNPTNGIAWNKGVPSSEESKRKNSLSHLGKQNNLGKHWKVKDTSKMRKNKEWLAKIRPNMKGENHPLWKGGANKPYLRKAILQRDNFTCQICGLRDEEIMEVDHIRPKAIAPELYTEPTNLICICPNCHRRKTNRDIKIIIDFKKGIIN